jgi:hypothetical protein
MNKRTISLFPSWVDIEAQPQIIKMLACYAAKNPCLNFRDYCRDWQDKDGRAAYFSEARSITNDLRRVREAILAAYYAGVTNDDLVECSQGERLTIEPTNYGFKLDYCVGQYWPTEYRGAVARLLHRATHKAARRNLVNAEAVA